MRNYYIYVLCFPLTGEVIYVGKGNGNRAYAHNSVRMGHSNEELSLIYSQLNSWDINDGQLIVKIINKQLTEEEALKQEVEYIAYYKSLGLFLVNKYEGGNGRKTKRP